MQDSGPSTGAEKRSVTQTIDFAARSHIGASPLRKLLEDRSRSDRVRTAAGLEMILGVVADGIGGENAGERAAEVTINTVFEYCSNSSERDIPGMLNNALQEANQRVYAESRRSRRKMNMGSTAAVAAIVEGRLYVANVGDSRVYLIRGGDVMQLTLDHTWGNEVVRSGRLGAEQAAKHPRREEIVRSIGYEKSLDVDLGLWQHGGVESEGEARAAQGILLQLRDRVLICSDGVTKSRHDKPEGHYVEEFELPKLTQARSPEQAVEAILKKARARKVDDNVSAVILEVAGGKKNLQRSLPLRSIPIRTMAVAASIVLLSAVGIWQIPKLFSDKPGSGVAPTTVDLPAGVAYVSQLNGFAEKQNPGSNYTGIQLEEILSSGQGMRIRTLGEDASLRLELADQSILYLGPSTQIELRSIADGNAAFETIIVLRW